MGRKIAVFLIAFFILACSSISMFHSYQVKEAMLGMITSAKEAAENNDTKQACELAKKMTSYWKKQEQYLILYVNHTEVDTLADIIAQLPTLIEYNDVSLFCSELDQALYTVEHIWMTQLPLPQNIL